MWNCSLIWVHKCNRVAVKSHCTIAVKRFHTRGIMLFVSPNSISIVAECENFVIIIETLRLQRLVAAQKEVDSSNDSDFDKSTLSDTRPS